jgi:hypothetical protein
LHSEAEDDRRNAEDQLVDADKPYQPPGNTAGITPKSTERTSLKAISHSFSISRLSQITQEEATRPARTLHLGFVEHTPETVW